MMRTKTKPTGMTNGSSVAAGGGGGGQAGSEWELRPGGMLVQRRTDSESSSVPPPTIRVRVKYGSIYHEINVSSQATFGELKKLLAGPTGLHHQDQKLFYKDKERDSKAFLDTCGVKYKSKIVLVEDPISQERRFLEMRKNAKMEKASKSISEISLEVDRLAGQVSALESITTKGGKVAEKDVLNLIELLMNQLLKLDGIVADGDVKLQRKMQVRRVQKYVETLDILKAKTSGTNGNGGHVLIQQPQKHSNGQRQGPVEERSARYPNGQRLAPIDERQQLKLSSENLAIHQQQQRPSSKHSTSGAVVVTTQWETFDSSPAIMPVPSASTSISAPNNSVREPKFPWDFYD